MAGAPSQKDATKFGQQVKNSRTLPYAWGSVAEGVDLAETKLLNSNLYPARFIPSDDQDTEWMIRQQLADPNANMITSARPMPWTEGEINYLKRKRDAEEYAAYNDWLTHKFPLNDPANREILKRTVPRYFEERKEVLQEQIALSAKYANLRLFGPENEDDLKLQYLVETNRVKLPEGPFHDPVKWMEREAAAEGLPTDTQGNFMRAAAKLNEKTYEKGLFNPFSFLTWKNAPWAPNAVNMADSVGDPRVKALGPYGTYAPTNENYGYQYRGESLGAAERARDWDAANRLVATTRQNIAALPGVGRSDAYRTYATAADDFHAGTRKLNWSNALRGFKIFTNDNNNNRVKNRLAAFPANQAFFEIPGQNNINQAVQFNDANAYRRRNP